MIGFPVQELLLLDQLVLFAKPRLTLRQRIAQAYFHGSVLDQLAFVARDGAARRIPKRQNAWPPPAALVGTANLLRNDCLIAHGSACHRTRQTVLTQINPKSDIGHCLAGLPAWSNPPWPPATLKVQPDL